MPVIYTAVERGGWSYRMYRPLAAKCFLWPEESAPGALWGRDCPPVAIPEHCHSAHWAEPTGKGLTGRFQGHLANKPAARTQQWHWLLLSLWFGMLYICFFSRWKKRERGIKSSSPPLWEQAEENHNYAAILCVYCHGNACGVEAQGMSSQADGRAHFQSFITKLE